MDFFFKVAKSGAGQAAMNAVRKGVESKIKEYNDRPKMPEESSGQENPTMWPMPANPEHRLDISEKLSSIFSFAAYGPGFALVYTPTNYIVYYNTHNAPFAGLTVLWKDFTETLLKLSDPIPLINKLVPLMLEDKKQGNESKAVVYAIMLNNTDFCNGQKNAGKLHFSLSEVNKIGDTPVHVAARFASLDTLKLLWEDDFDPLKCNRREETILDAAIKRPEIVKYIMGRVGQTFGTKMARRNDYLIPNAAVCPETFNALSNYWTKSDASNFAISLAEIIERSKLSPEDMEIIVRMYSEKDAMLLPSLARENILETFAKIPEQYQKTVLGFVSTEMLNSKNLLFKERTPIHCHAKRGDLTTFLLFWSRGADINNNDQDGFFPMDYAIMEDHVHIVKACLVFGGAVNERTVMSALTATPPKKCTELLRKHYQLIKEAEKLDTIKFNPKNPTHRRCQNFPKLSERDTIALAIDGGGMKGILALQVLKEIEMVKGNDFLHWFNHFAGTSTGSIITLGLAKYKNIDHALRTYFRLKNEIFTGSRPYSGDKLEAALIEEFGSVPLKTLCDKKNVRVCIPVTRVDVSPPMLCMFRSYELEEEPAKPGFEKPEWSAAKIVRASCAAPSFFPTVDGKFMDGGLVANNPTMDLLTDCQRLAFERQDSKMSKIVVSIGTGSLTKRVENVDFVAPTTLDGIINTMNKIIHLKDVFIDQITLADGVTVERSRWMAEAMGMAFFRFTPNLEFPIAIDEKDDLVLLDAMLAVKYDVISMRNEINMLSSILQ